MNITASRTGEDPIALFQTWFAEAIDSGIEEPSAMTVATVDVQGYPDARMMLLKHVDERGFVFTQTWEAPRRRRFCMIRTWRSAFIGRKLASRCAFAGEQRV